MKKTFKVVADATDIASEKWYSTLVAGNDKATSDARDDKE